MRQGGEFDSWVGEVRNSLWRPLAGLDCAAWLRRAQPLSNQVSHCLMTKSLPVRLLNVAAEFTNWNPLIDKIRTFVDSGVLITAARGSGESAHDALAILTRSRS